MPLTVGHYLNSLPKLSGQFDSYNYTQPSRQRLYLKDIDCPPEWHEALGQLIPPSLFYLNRSPKPFSGPGSQSSNITTHQTTPDGVPIAEAGDLMSCLPPAMRAENLMCYIGHEGTYTPAHQEMCASLGHNIMVEASEDSHANGRPTRQGSSIWLMTQSDERDVVREYWLSTLGHDIGLEDHFAQLNAWRGAPFSTFVVEQRPGDLILIPPLAAHQVWNRGTRTIKVAWNRTTVDTLKMAMMEALPHARMVCRDEQYKNKAIIYHSLEWYSELLQHAPGMGHPEVAQLSRSFEKLFRLFTDILWSECFSEKLPAEEDVELIEFDGSVTCSYCRCNIFNRFLTCPWCCGPQGADAYDICMDCYVLGRSCSCISQLKWVEQFRWDDLLKKYTKWRRQIVSFDQEDKGRRDRFPVLSVFRGHQGRKSIAEICQEQLALRPWSDCNQRTQPKTTGDSDDDRQARKRRRGQRAEVKIDQTGTCHACGTLEPSWKLATCSSCNAQYCYAVLFRAFDILPQVAMEKPQWLCPRCRKICNCDTCRRDPVVNPHEPYNVLLGHDTRKIADPRSVESLVNLRLTNRKWLQMFGNDTKRRLENRQQQATERRAQMLKDHQILVDSIESDSSNGSPSNTHDNDAFIPVDPSLELDGSFMGPNEGS